MPEVLYTPGQLSKLWKVSPQTLKTWAKEGKIRAIVTTGGHHRYSVEEVNVVGEKRNFIYARVSSAKQAADLSRQIAKIKKQYPDHEVISDIASGINFKRKGLLRILELLFKGNIGEVVVAHRDRFSRFGFEFFEWIFAQHRSILTVLHDNKAVSQQQELTEDLMAIITVFTARYHGRRKYQQSEQTNPENQNLSEQKAN